VVSIRCRFSGFVWLEELIDIAEGAGSSPVFALLKREDEKHVTEQAFENPTFVEDVARRVASALTAHPRITWFRVEVESFESIHNHSAFADIEGRKPRDHG
jgi:GTP cyclohydrolase I